MTSPGSRWSAATGVQRGADYDARWVALEASGQSIHGEADFIGRYHPQTVLDAGCGTGRVAAELATRGVEVVGVDLDPQMLAQARAKAPHLSWIEADLMTVALGRTFDVVAMPGNVMIFVHPGTEVAVVENMVSHVGEGGLLIAGFQLGRGYALREYDEHCTACGLERVERFATWDGAPFRDGGDYAVSVHRVRG